MNLPSNDGLTVEQEEKKLLRADRQRRMGDELASAELTDEENDWLELGPQTLREAGKPTFRCEATAAEGVPA
jgi:hypothetical protein